MVNRPNRPGNRPQRRDGDRSHKSQQKKDTIDSQIVNEINSLESLKHYDIRMLVQQSKELGYELKIAKLETNQIRKFLDAIKRIKANLIQVENESSEAPENETREEKEKRLAKLEFDKIKDDIVLLKPKLAYAAARQAAAKPLGDAMTAAIDKVKDLQDFTRLVQFIESIIAYHKAAGGK